MQDKCFNLFDLIDILRGEFEFIPENPVNRHKRKYPFGRLGDIYITAIDTNTLDLVTLTLLHDRFTVRSDRATIEKLNRHVLGARYIPHGTDGDQYDVVISLDVVVDFVNIDRFRLDMETGLSNLKRYAKILNDESMRYEKRVDECEAIYRHLYMIEPDACKRAGTESERYIQEAAKRNHQTREQIIQRIMAGEAFEVSDANDKTCIYISLEPEKGQLTYYHIDEEQDKTEWINQRTAIEIYQSHHDAMWFYIDARLKASEIIKLEESRHMIGKPK